MGEDAGGAPRAGDGSGDDERGDASGEGGEVEGDQDEEDEADEDDCDEDEAGATFSTAAEKNSGTAAIDWRRGGRGRPGLLA